MAKHKPTSTPPPSVLRPEVAAVYQVRPGLPAKFACAEFGLVNLSEVSLAKAGQLAGKGYLKKLDQPDRP